MADKDVNIHVKAPGARQARQHLDGVAGSAKGVGDAVHTSGTKGADGMDKLGRSTKSTGGIFRRLTSSVTGWVAGLASLAAAIRFVTSAINDQMEAIKEHARIAAEQQKELTRLQFLGGFFKEHPEARKEVAAYAELGRRPFEEVADAWYNLRSKGGALTADQRASIMKEALELGRTDPKAPLNTLVDMFSLFAKQTGEADANRIQNVLLQTITEAGGGTGDVAKYMPQFLPIGISGGLSGAQSAGLWAYVTTQLAEPSIATTGLKATFMGLQGRGSPESQKLLASLGISPGMGFFEKINLLSAAGRTGRFGLSQAEQLAGREGAAVLLSMLKDPQAMMRTIGAVTGADTGAADLTGDMIKQLMTADEFARAEEDLRQLEVMIENVKGSDIDALRWQTIYKKYEYLMRKKGRPEWYIQKQLWMMKHLSGVGLVELPEQKGPVIIDNSVDNSMNFTPVVGSNIEGETPGPRYTPY